ELAKSWKSSPDGKTITFSLRPNIKFTDGATLSADDVVFTFQIINDPQVSAPVSDQFKIEGRRVEVREIDLFNVSFTFPIAYADAIRLFDGIPILPRHKLETIYHQGKFTEAWSLSTPPDQIVGLGPFKLKSFTAGQRVVLVRNENYWKTDSAGRRLPYLDEIVFTIDPDRNTQLLRFQKGETDLLSPLNAEDVATLSPLVVQGKIDIANLGASLIREVLWFNMNDGKQGIEPIKMRWFKEVKFRQAISHAIDRNAIVKLAFSGKAVPQWGFLSEGNKFWYDANVKKYPY